MEEILTAIEAAQMLHLSLFDFRNDPECWSLPRSDDKTGRFVAKHVIGLARKRGIRV